MSSRQFEQGFNYVKLVFANDVHLLASITRFLTAVDRVLQRRNAPVVTSIKVTIAVFTTAFTMPSLQTFLIPRVSLVLLSIGTLTHFAQFILLEQTLILNLHDFFVFLLLLKCSLAELCLILLMVCIQDLLLILFFFFYHLG